MPPGPCKLCGGILKVRTISFGQSLDESILKKSQVWLREADVLLVMGSSLVVQPAASLILLASQAKRFLINREATPMDTYMEACFYEETKIIWSAYQKHLKI